MEIGNIKYIDKIKEDLIVTEKIIDIYLKRTEFERYLNLLVEKTLSEILKIEEIIEIDQNKSVYIKYLQN